MITSVFGNKVREDNHFARYFTRNKEAVDAFFKRKSEYGGLNLSQRVWKYTGDLKTEMEMALSVSIGEGQSASTISRRVRKYLQNPDLMFRRFRVKTGEEDILDADGNVTGKRSVFGRVWKRKVVDAKTGDVSWQTVNLKDYSFGRGVYRSSYKNAMRLARTETNMAYRSAEQDRWRRMDFILGYRVVMSDNHPEHDICDYLSAKRGETSKKGTYPKDFVFKGWHPQCRCYVVPIIADDDEFDRMQEAIAEGREPAESENMIREPNGEFTKWWADNKQRVASAQSLPYWVKDNRHMFDTPKYAGTKLGRAQNKQAYKVYGDNGGRPMLSKEQVANIQEIAKILGVKGAINPMSFSEADSGRGNVNYHKGGGYRENCQSCVVVHEARLRGLDATTREYDPKNPIMVRLGNKFESAWINPKNNKMPHAVKLTGDNLLSKLEKQTKAIGRYHIGINNIDGSGHVLVAERLNKGKLIIYDPQRNEFPQIDIEICDYLEVLKVDNLIINPISSSVFELIQ